MLGLGCIEIAVAYWLCIISAVGCIAYGALNWNSKEDRDPIKVKRTILPGNTESGE